MQHWKDLKIQLDHNLKERQKREFRHSTPIAIIIDSLHGGREGILNEHHLEPCEMSSFSEGKDSTVILFLTSHYLYVGICLASKQANPLFSCLTRRT